MAEPAEAVTSSAGRIGNDVKNDVVRMRCVRNTENTREVVEFKQIA